MKRSEYEKKATAFRTLLEKESQKPTAEQDWETIQAKWLTVPAVLTCTTPACASYGQSSEMAIHENADGIYRAECGPGQHEITDIRLVLED